MIQKYSNFFFFLLVKSIYDQLQIWDEIDKKKLKTRGNAGKERESNGHQQ